MISLGGGGGAGGESGGGGDGAGVRGIIGRASEGGGRVSKSIPLAMARDEKAGAGVSLAFFSRSLLWRLPLRKVKGGGEEGEKGKCTAG